MQTVLFWKPHEHPYGCLSNWSDHAIVVDGVRFRTVEHFLMFSKATLFKDGETAQRIRATSHPAEAKRLGRLVRNFSDPVWTLSREHIMLKGLRAKTEQHPHVKQLLLSTQEKYIAENSPMDAIWGIGKNGEGLNLLGKLWVRVREELLIVSLCTIDTTNTRE